MKVKVYKHSHLLFEAQFSQEDLIDGTEIFIGREQDCHLILDDPQVSRHHAVIIISKDSILLKKLSKFGELLLNGNAVSDAKLEKNGQVLIGEHLLEISELESVVLESNQEAGEVNTLSENTTGGPSDNEQDKGPGEQTMAEFDSIQSDEKVDSDIQGDEEQSTDTDEFDTQDSNDDFLNRESDSEENNDFNSDASESESEESNFSDDGFSESDGFSSDDDGFGGDDNGFGGEDSGFGGDNSFGGDGGGFGGDSSESTQVFQSFASYSLKIFGEFAPFDTFTIDDNEVFIGRDTEKCQIILNDPEVSSVHAKIKKSLINCVLEDLNSSNGTILNGDRINKSELTNGDEFVIGETSFTVQISSDLLEAEKDTLMPVQDNQEVEVVEEVEEEVDFDEFAAENDGFAPEEEEPKSLVQKIMKDPKKKRMAMVGIVLLMVLFLFDDESEPPKTEKNKTKNKDAKVVDGKNNEPTGKIEKKKLSPQVIEKLEQNYALALAKYEEAKYSDAKVYLDTVRSIDPDYKDTQTLLKLVKQGYEELTRLKKEEQEEKERQKRALEIKKLVDKAKEAVEKREVQISRNYFSQILEKDPENLDVPQLKMIIDAHVKEIEEKKMAEEQAKIRRQNMVDALKPAKTLFLRGDWYEAIGELEKFTKKQGIDEDLVKEATDMLKQSRQKLSSVVNPLLGRARSFKEGQDLKRAYETFGEILVHQPTNEEALNERQEIKESLDTRSRKIYREALISESLSLFNEAKEKFQEVQQVSPVGSEYYIKATNKLKEYLE
jgi:pSer/pThr/pTyr-binding forkhead associated (FHA) protein/tetratricopeptide (TPR) repeat protein